jgi:hypothetical protein
MPRDKATNDALHGSEAFMTGQGQWLSLLAEVLQDLRLRSHLGTRP